MEARRTDLTTSIGLLLLRLGMGGFMMSHGWGKVQMLIAGNFEGFGDPIGIGSPLSLVLVVGAEFVCAGLVMLGFATRFTALPIVMAMGVAAFVAHGGDPWTMGEGARLFMEKQAPSWASKEPALLFLIPYLTLALTGAGRFSVDALLGSRRAAGRAAQA